MKPANFIIQSFLPTVIVLLLSIVSLFFHWSWLFDIVRICEIGLCLYLVVRVGKVANSVLKIKAHEDLAEEVRKLRLESAATNRVASILSERSNPIDKEITKDNKHESDMDRHT